MAEFRSKRATVSRPPYQLYMAFVDMRNFIQFLPEDKKALVINYGKLTKAEESIAAIENATEAPTEAPTEPPTEAPAETPSE